jgi:16S rRNA processing protein RimM
MRKEDVFYVGKIAKKFSFKGEVLIYLDTDEPEILTELESVIVEFNHNLIPFFIEKSSFHKNDYLRVKFEDVDSEADADAILGSDVYLPITLLPELSDNQFYYHEIIGFELIDENSDFRAPIARVNDSNFQVLLEVDYQNQTILIPLVDEFIIKVDKANKQFIMRLPVGLVNING